MVEARDAINAMSIMVVPRKRLVFRNGGLFMDSVRDQLRCEADRCNVENALPLLGCEMVIPNEARCGTNVVNPRAVDLISVKAVVRDGSAQSLKRFAAT